MSGHFDEVVIILLDGEVEPPVPVDPCLPQPCRLVVFLRAQGRVMRIGKQKTHLLIQGSLNFRGSFRVDFQKPLRVVGIHARTRDFFASFSASECKERSKASAELNGPYTRPFLTSSSPSTTPGG